MTPGPRRNPAAAAEVRADADPRAREEQLLERCAAAATGSLSQAADAQEASVFLLAAALLPPHLAAEAARLRSAAQVWHGAGETVDAGEVVRRGWVVSLPRFRQAISERLARTRA